MYVCVQICGVYISCNIRLFLGCAMSVLYGLF